MTNSNYAMHGGENMDHSTALQRGVSMTEMAARPGTAEAMANALTDIVSKTLMGGPIVNDAKSQLHNGQVSVYQWNSTEGNVTTNNATIANGSTASTSKTSDGKFKVTYNMFTGNDLHTTVENIQNTFIHEFVGHGKNGWGDATGTHNKVFDLQKSHSTWPNTTPDFKNYIHILSQQNK